MQNENLSDVALHDVEQQIKELNREMLRLPLHQRRRRWNDYLRRLGDLTGQSTPGVVSPTYTGARPGREEPNLIAAP